MNDKPTGPDRPILEVQDLRTYFHLNDRIVRAVDGVDFELGIGQTLAIVGESGSGKTVLARSIMNLVFSASARFPTGAVLFDGVDLRSLSRREMRSYWGRRIAMVFQDPMTSLNPTRRLSAQMSEPLMLHLGMSKRAANERALELLRLVGISAPEKRLHQYPHELSGGMRQRVTIAMALSCGPALLLADEPTTALDVTVQQQILDLLDDLQSTHDMGTILITHDLGVAASRSDEVIVMYGGQVVERATAADLFRAPLHPYTEALLDSIPRIETPPHARLNAIDGRPPDLTQEFQGCRFAPRCRYATDRCRTEVPGLEARSATGTRSFRCFYPLSEPSGVGVTVAPRRLTQGVSA